jgi:hypothetical protein
MDAIDVPPFIMANRDAGGETFPSTWFTTGPLLTLLAVPDDDDELLGVELDADAGGCFVGDNGTTVSGD